MSLTEKQIRRCLVPVRQDRIEQVQGMSYVPQQEVRAELTRTLGPGNWDSTIHSVELIYETSVNRSTTDVPKLYWSVCYRAACTLRIRDYDGNQIAEFTEHHAEECAPQPNRGEAHALALTSVASYALRRAAIGLGDNFGLHLYAKGSLAPLIKGTLMLTERYPSPKAAEAPDATLTDEQRKVLESSLGATLVAEQPAEPAETTPVEETVNA